MGDLLCTNLTQIWNAFITPSKCQVNCTFGSRCDGQETLHLPFDSSIFHKKQMIQSWPCFYSCFTFLFFSRTGGKVAKICLLYYNILQQLHSKFFYEFFLFFVFFVCFSETLSKRFWSFSFLVCIVHSWVFLYFYTCKQPNSFFFKLVLFSGCMK